MPSSLFIDRRHNGLTFYINGDLQFDTADEALYHEYLVIPTVSVAVNRFPKEGLRVLICGGGDGLAARDVLRFPEVSHIDLVDYNPEILELGRTVFKPYNGGSLKSDRLTVYAQEAFEFISAIPDNSYHIIIGDFTYPTCFEDTTIYSREWFQQINRAIVPGGLLSTNAVSPSNRTSGYWCLYQTLLSAGLKAKPLQLEIPSFQRHGYGNWGFFLASKYAIHRTEIEAIAFPEKLQVLTRENLSQAFIFPEEIANSRHDATIHTLDCPQLFYYLLNPNFTLPEIAEEVKTVDFLDIQESGTELLGKSDRLALESMVQAWLEQIYQSSDAAVTDSDINKLLPVQHRYHSPKMTREWFGYIGHLLGEIDLSRLLHSVLERAPELPPKLANDLKQLADKIRAGQPLSNLSPKTAEFLMMLSVTLLMANLLTPDVVFAKGYYRSGSSSYSSRTASTFDNKLLGIFFTGIGGFWLGQTLKNFLGDNNE